MKDYKMREQKNEESAWISCSIRQIYRAILWERLEEELYCENVKILTFNCKHCDITQWVKNNIIFLLVLNINEIIRKSDVCDTFDTEKAKR